MNRKYEEINPPHVDDFCYITDNTYTKEEVVKMEADVLKSLKFEMGNPTVKTFLRLVRTTKHLYLSLIYCCCCILYLLYVKFFSFNFVVAEDTTVLPKKLKRSVFLLCVIYVLVEDEIFMFIACSYN